MRNNTVIRWFYVILCDSMWFLMICFAEFCSQKFWIPKYQRGRCPTRLVGAWSWQWHLCHNKLGTRTSGALPDPQAVLSTWTFCGHCLGMPRNISVCFVVLQFQSVSYLVYLYLLYNEFQSLINLAADNTIALSPAGQAHDVFNIKDSFSMCNIYK